MKLKVLTVPGCLMVTGSHSQVVSGFWQVSCKPFFSLITGYFGGASTAILRNTCERWQAVVLGFATPSGVLLRQRS